MATVTQNPTNSSHMKTFENMAARRVRAGEYIDYSATPFYETPGLAPTAILMTAHSPHGTREARIVLNPAGRQKR